MATRARRAAPTPVYLESGARRVFACALDWPGWCRSGKDEQRALEVLAAAAPRYAVVAAQAGVPFPAGAGAAFDVVERLPGSATTDFGAPVVEKGWPPRYAARRIAWHVLDHAWEIEDRSGPPPA